MPQNYTNICDIYVKLRNVRARSEVTWVLRKKMKSTQFSNKRV